MNGFPDNIPLPFVLLDGVLHLDAHQMVAVRRFTEAPLWQGLESMAQAAALHQRVIHDFSKHAFLLSLGETRYPCLTPLYNESVPDRLLPDESLRDESLPNKSLPNKSLYDESLHATSPHGDHKAVAPEQRDDTGRHPDLRPATHTLVSLHGDTRLVLTVEGQSQHAAVYTALMEGAGWSWTVSLHIGLKPYDATFREDCLAPRYRELYAWLRQHP